MHYFILYQWDASVNSSTHAAFAESRRAETAPHVSSTQVRDLPQCLASWLKTARFEERLDLLCAAGLRQPRIGGYRHASI